MRQTGSRYPYAQALLESIGRALVEKSSRLTGPETQFLRKRLQNGSVIMHSHGHDGWLLRKNAVTFRTVLSASFSLLLLSSAFWPRRHADFGAINEAFHLNAGVEFPKKTRRLYTMDYASLVSPRPGDFPGVMKCRSEVRDKTCARNPAKAGKSFRMFRRLHGSYPKRRPRK